MTLKVQCYYCLKEDLLLPGEIFEWNWELPLHKGCGNGCMGMQVSNGVLAWLGMKFITSYGWDLIVLKTWTADKPTPVPANQTKHFPVLPALLLSGNSGASSRNSEWILAWSSPEGFGQLPVKLKDVMKFGRRLTCVFSWFSFFVREQTLPEWSCKLQLSSEEVKAFGGFF